MTKAFIEGKNEVKINLFDEQLVRSLTKQMIQLVGPGQALTRMEISLNKRFKNEPHRTKILSVYMTLVREVVEEGMGAIVQRR